MVFGFITLFIKFNKWFNNNRESTALKVTVYIIRVIIKKINKCIKKNRGYSILFIIKIQIS